MYLVSSTEKQSKHSFVLLLQYNITTTTECANYYTKQHIPMYNLVS